MRDSHFQRRSCHEAVRTTSSRSRRTADKAKTEKKSGYLWPWSIDGADFSREGGAKKVFPQEFEHDIHLMCYQSAIA